MNFCFIADYFTDDLPFGGAEICNSVLVGLLREQGHTVLGVKAAEVNHDLINLFEGTFIVSNRMTLPYEMQKALQSKDYIIYEHDFGCIQLRDPSLYDGYIAPLTHRINIDFYKNARKVILQSDPHLKWFKANSGLENLVSAKSNPFQQDHLDLLSEIETARRQNGACKDSVAVLDHPYWQKNTAGAVEYCQKNQLKFTIIPRMPNDKFLKELACYKALVFLPQVFETFSRVCAEAACIGLDVITNSNVSFAQSDYAESRGQSLINYFKRNNQQIVQLFV